MVGQDKHFKKIYVMGKIFFKEEKVAQAGETGRSDPWALNPYRLSPGMRYYEVSVTSVSALLDDEAALMMRLEGGFKNSNNNLSSSTSKGKGRTSR
jgi:hypothetical protein